MKKIKIISATLALLLMINIVCFAAIDQTVHFDISYEGEVKVNEEKSTLIILAGQNTPTHSNVRVKVEIEGPEKPKLLAKDSLGTEIDIAKEGYWGPQEGFPITGNFSNETPVKATFTKAGSYTITLKLLDVKNGNDILAEKSVTIQVKENVPIANEIANTITNEIVNEPTSELPKTGTSLVEYVIYAVVLIAIIYLGYQIKERRK